MANAELLPELIQMIEEGHSITLPLRGYSMRPFLENGRDKAVLCSPGKLQVGDVVLAETNPKQYVLHRIIRIADSNLTLLGDGNLTVEHCKKADVKAVATGFYRKRRTHIDGTNGLKWRTYSWIWMRLYPVRRYILFIYRHLFL